MIGYLGETTFRSNGNRTGDPLFVDRAMGNYELAAGSPAVDSGRAISATVTDMLGRSRFDDLGLENLGSGLPSYVDMGALERQESTAPAADLAVVDVSATPLDVAAEGSLTVTWTIENTGQRNLTEDWTDAIYLSSDPYLSTADDRLLAEVSRTDDLTAGSRYSGTWSGAIPVGVAGPQYVIVQTNSRRAFRESDSTNNTRTFDRVVGVAIPTLTTASPQTGHVNQGQWAYYRFEAQPGQSVCFTLDSVVSSGAVHLYLRRGAIPTVSNCDVAATAFNQPDQELRLLNPSAGVHYIGVFGQSLAAGGTDFTLTAELTSLAIRQVSPSTVGNAGTATVKITGDNFAEDFQVTLIAPDGTTIIEAQEWFQDGSTLFATFDLAGASAGPGVYDVVVTDPGAASMTKFDALTVQAGGSANLTTNLIVPGTARPSREIQVTVEYANTGNIDLASPLMTIESVENTPWLFVCRSLVGTTTVQSQWIVSSSVSFLAISLDGPASILRPGESVSLTITVKTPFNPGDMPFTLYAFGLPGDAGLTQAIDWIQLGTDIRPPNTPDDAWNPLFERLKAQVGTTWGDYLNVLRDNANHLAEIEQRTYDAAELFAFEFVQAATMGTPTYLEAAQDAFCPAPGLPLSFERYFLPGLSYRARLGSMGRGWTHSYEITLQKRSDGSVVINGPSGFDRTFESDGSGGYSAGAGDYGGLTALPDNEFLLTEQSGMKIRFRSDGRFDSIEDTNGNRIMASYDAQGRLVAVVHSNGDRFRLAYDANGRLVSLTDHAGRVTAYAYDATSEHLLSVTGPDGRTTAYTYIAGTGVLKDHHISSIARPGGFQTSFTYDSLGRLSEQHVGTDEEAVTYAYSTAGKTFVTDALGNTTTIWLDSGGRTTRVRDPLGNAVAMSYDAQFNLTSVVGPTGLTSSFTYDEQGGLTASQDPMGYVTQFAYAGAYHDMTLVRDARGNGTSNTYDSVGNLTKITYADGTYETYAYDAAGNLIRYTNRRGNATPDEPDDHIITYTYNGRGQLTSKQYADDTVFTYTYDTAGRLVQTTDSNGTTTLEYYADDRLKKITYPGDLWLEYTYDTAERRASMLDQLGHRLEYHYDAAARLEYMTDETGAEIVHYTYDAAGRLIHKLLGNGVYATYEHDPAGQLLHLVNCQPDGTVLSHFDYTYDSRGRRISMDTHYGLWTYEYDDNGQLIHAVLDSTDPDIPDQDLVYVYDALGNRIYTITNGVREDYTTNNMNQYVQAGDTTYVFDADGNLVQEVSPTGTTGYTYNDENRLVVVDKAPDLWQYNYDAFRERVATTENGATTRFTVDPIHLGNLVAEYDGSGNLIAHYDYGLSLVSRIDTVAEAAYYTFDAVGNAQQLVTSASSCQRVRLCAVWYPPGKYRSHPQSIPVRRRVRRHARR